MNTAWLFPGQGTQTVGMGQALFAASPAARRVFERADEALGWSLTRLCFEGPEAQLTLTANAQPAIVTTSIAALEAVREGFPGLPTPTLAAGHSLGEYSALVAAGALSLEDAVRLVHLRGQAMQSAVAEGQGAMAAIMGGTPETVRELCSNAADGETLTPANYNAPGQIVIAGSAGAVARARARASELGMKAIPLKVSAPFHCKLMQPAAEAVAKALTSIKVRPLLFPVISNVEALPNLDSAAVADLLVRQITGAVRWEESMALMAPAGVTNALEIGPGKVLAGLLKRSAKEITVLSVSTPETVAEARAFVAAEPGRA